MQRDLLPNYAAVYVVSDLHLGGFQGEFRKQARNYRIFRETKALAWFVRSLSTRPEKPEKPAALAHRLDPQRGHRRLLS